MHPLIHSTATRRRPINAAFSLVELSVVIVIISIVAMMGLEITASFFNRTAYQVTVDRLNAIDAALVDFQHTYGYLPCPAHRYGDTNCSCYGKAAYDDGVSVSCTTGSVTCGAYGNSCNAGLIASTSLQFGDVPVRDLGLPISHMVDGYGGRIRYIVHRNYTGSSTYNTDSSATEIEVRSGKIEATCTTRCQTRGNAAYLLLSQGKDRRGSISALVYNMIFACATSPQDDGKIDATNCRFGGVVDLKYGGASVVIPNNVFYDNRFNAGTQNESYFDDIVKWRTKNNI